MHTRKDTPLLANQIITRLVTTIKLQQSFLKKLQKLNFEPEVLSQTESFLCGRIKIFLQTPSSDWMQLNQGVLQGLFIGPLLYNISVNIMQYEIASPLKLVQYGNDFFVAEKTIDKGIDLQQQNIEDKYFLQPQIDIKVEKFVIYCKPPKSYSMENTKLI